MKTGKYESPQYKTIQERKRTDATFSCYNDIAICLGMDDEKAVTAANTDGRNITAREGAMIIKA